MSGPGPNTSAILPAKPSPYVRPWFTRIANRKLRKNFHALHLTKPSLSVLHQAAAHQGPLLLTLNHPSWWDPLIANAVLERFFADRPPAAPMDAEQWRRYRVMRSVGMFGVDTQHPEAFDHFTQHVRTLFTHDPTTVLALTPQGEFQDPRAPIRLRPGAAAIAAATPDLQALMLNLEYVSAEQPKPEVFAHITPVPEPATHSVTGWHRALTQTMQQGGAHLAQLVISRDRDGCVPLLDKSPAQAPPRPEHGHNAANSRGFRLRLLGPSRRKNINQHRCPPGDPAR